MDPFQSTSRQGAYFQASTGRNRAILMLLVTMKFRRYLSGWVVPPAQKMRAPLIPPTPGWRLLGPPLTCFVSCFSQRKSSFRLKTIRQRSVEKTTIINPQLTSTKRLNPNLLTFANLHRKEPLVKKCCNMYWTFIWLLVSTHVGKIRSFPLVRVKIKICETTT